MIVIGFTGTQHGMTDKQRDIIFSMLKGAKRVDPLVVLHHGDCIGADAQVHAMARRLGFTVAGHPPAKVAKRAFCTFDIKYPEKDYLVRNRAIVDSCDYLIAASRTRYEELRSGTWSTVRYCRSIDKKVFVIGPDGQQVG